MENQELEIKSAYNQRMMLCFEIKLSFDIEVNIIEYTENRQLKRLIDKAIDNKIKPIDFINKYNKIINQTK